MIRSLLTSDPPTVPQPLARLVGRLPQYPHGVVFSLLANRFLLARLPRESLKPLHGRHICLRIRDLGMDIHFALEAAGFRPMHPAHDADLTVTARLVDFLRLARGEEDADSLFFSRRLLMEGDTELGVLAKNLLFSMEAPLAGRRR